MHLYNCKKSILQDALIIVKNLILDNIRFEHVLINRDNPYLTSQFYKVELDSIMFLNMISKILI